MSNIMLQHFQMTGLKVVLSKIIPTVFCTSIIAHINNVPYAWLSSMDVTHQSTRCNILSGAVYILGISCSFCHLSFNFFHNLIWKWWPAWNLYNLKALSVKPSTVIFLSGGDVETWGKSIFSFAEWYIWSI